MTHAAPSWVRYLLVWVALIALTLLSWLLSLAHLGSTDIAVALVIATAKTVLVMLFFMHLVEERFSIVVIPFVAAGFIALLIGLTVTDVATRLTFPKAPLLSVDAPGSLE
jgi:cytochrome c oxidase subunit IV